jgi:hypothetical protein
VASATLLLLEESLLADELDSELTLDCELLDSDDDTELADELDSDEETELSELETELELTTELELLELPGPPADEPPQALNAPTDKTRTLCCNQRLDAPAISGNIM